MATALAYFVLDEGFVLAADGLNTLVSGKDRRESSRKVQKIFPIGNQGSQVVACSFMGRISLYKNVYDDLPAFDFTSAFVQAANEIPPESLQGASDLLSRACPVLQRRLKYLKQTGGIAKYPGRRNMMNPQHHRIVTINIDGYFLGHPDRAGVEFYHVDQEVKWDTNSHTLNRPKREWTVLHGSQLVSNLLFNTDDARLAQYRTESCNKVAAAFNDPRIEITMKDAINAGRNFIQACSSKIARDEIDPENCRGIGGEPQIAIIAKEGFQWVTRPDHFDPL